MYSQQHPSGSPPVDESGRLTAAKAPVSGVSVPRHMGVGSDLVHTLDYVVLLPSEERCVEGVATRHNHAFSDEAATRKMHGEFARADVADRHVLTDPPNGPDAVADLIVAARDGGELRFAL